MNSLVEIAQTREQLQQAYDFLISKMKRYNHSIVHREKQTLHRSFEDAFKESSDRAAMASSRAFAAEDALKKIQKQFKKEKHPLSLIYGIRKRKEGKLINKTARRRFL
jgi:hypothetical protein